jgi:protein-S-isoprenylcysteine O-methyltransferase Ste14
MNLHLKAALGLIFDLFFIPWLTFTLVGHWNWGPGWIFYFMFIVMIGFFTAPLLKNKQLMAERMKSPFQKEQPLEDKVFMGIFITTFTAWWVMMPLDSARYEWTPDFPLWLSIVGIVLWMGCNVLIYYVFEQNSFAAPVIKKQKGQTVVSTGLYGVVRHPMYSGLILMLFGAPLILSSYWGIALAILNTLILAYRTELEESLLERELKGYKAYKKKVKYRLIPYVF